MRHTGKQLLFTLLGLADLALTLWLVSRPGCPAYEANPLAGWCLARLGWVGLAGYKALAVAVVLGLAVCIARSRPRLAERVLGVGCVATGLVVLYSAGLALAAAADESLDDPLLVQRINAEYEPDNRVRTEVHRRRCAFFTRLSADLVEGRCTLLGAAKRVEGSEFSRDPNWRKGVMANYPGRPFAEVAALIALANVLHGRDDPPPARRALLRRLEGEFQRAFGRGPPPALSAEMHDEGGPDPVLRMPVAPRERRPADGQVNGRQAPSALAEEFEFEVVVVA